MRALVSVSTCSFQEILADSGGGFLVPELATSSLITSAVEEIFARKNFTIHLGGKRVKAVERGDYQLERIHEQEYSA
jgi:hypothetical protein